MSVTKMVKGLRKIEYEERLQRLKMTTLEKRWLRRDMIETWKVLNGKEDIDCSRFFQMATASHNLTVHSTGNIFVKYRFVVFIGLTATSVITGITLPASA